MASLFRGPTSQRRMGFRSLLTASHAKSEAIRKTRDAHSVLAGLISNELSSRRTLRSRSLKSGI
jgi:hypothetical protein